MKKSKKLVLTCIIIIVIIIVGRAIGYYILNNKDKQKEADIRKALEQELRLSDRMVEYGTEINLLDTNETNNKCAKENKRTGIVCFIEKYKIKEKR